MRGSVDLTVSQLKTVRSLLKQYLPGLVVWAYGSRVKWTSRPESDLDLVVFADTTYKARVPTLREAFEESNLPFRVDLFVWDEVPQKFRKIIEAEHVVIQEKEQRRWGMGSGWKTGTVSSIAKVTMGQSPKGETCNNDVQGVPLLNGPTEFGSYHPIPVQFTSDPKKLSQTGDLLFCVRGSTTGKMNWADQEYAIGRGIASIRHKEGIEYQHFLKAIIHYRLPELLGIATGSTFPNISRPQLLDLEILVPPLPKQRAIAHILGSLDDKIELNRQMNQTLETMAQAIFKSWFIDFDPVHAKAAGRDPGLPKEIADLFPDSFEDSELGEIPKGWKVSSIGEHAEKISKGTTPRKNDILDAKDALVIPFLKVKNLSGTGHIDIPSLEKIPKSIHEGALKRSILKKGDVLFTIAGTIGRVSIVSDELHNSNTNQAIAFIRIPKNGLSNNFVRLLLKTDKIQFDAASKAVQAVQANVSLTVLSQLQFVCPNVGVLDFWRQDNRELFARQESLDSENRILTALRDTLLPKLISGELRVPDAEKLLEGLSD